MPSISAQVQSAPMWLAYEGIYHSPSRYIHLENVFDFNSGVKGRLYTFVDVSPV
jgi:hypothetical protein